MYISGGFSAKINVYGGVGGKGGVRGDGDFSIAEGITGILGAVTDGTKGSDGAAYVCVNCIKLSGTLHEN